MQEGAQTSTFVYDADGNRLVREDASGTTIYLPGMELRSPDGVTKQAIRYYQHAGQPLGMRADDNKLTWLVGDHNGTNTLAVDSTTQAVQRRYSTPYGGDRGTAPASWPDDKGFVGGAEDSTGLTDLGAREYDPETGRFASVDPVIDPNDPQQMHGYAYASNSPVTYSDPSGLRDFCGNAGGDVRRGSGEAEEAAAGSEAADAGRGRGGP